MVVKQVCCGIFSKFLLAAVFRKLLFMLVKRDVRVYYIIIYKV